MRVDDATAELFSRYQVHGDPDAKEELVLLFMPLVEYVAKSLGRRLINVELDDLVGYGSVGLMDAIERFDVERECQFSTYAVTRIRGSILDSIRNMDWAPRALRSQSRQIDRATETLTHKFGREPTSNEVGSLVGIDPEQVALIRSDVAMAQVSYYEQPHHQAEVAPIELVNDQSADPSEMVTDWDLAMRLSVAVQKLDWRGRAVVALYYLRGATLSDIGYVLGVTESRVCQIHTKVLESLRAHVTA